MPDQNGFFARPAVRQMPVNPNNNATISINDIKQIISEVVAEQGLPPQFTDNIMEKVAKILPSLNNNTPNI